MKMKVYNRKDFLNLPQGTIFCKGTKWYFDNISVKGSSLNNDFVYVDLCNIEANDTGQWVDRLEESLLKGVSFPINKDSARDGMFDDNSVFLVFEKEDLKYLIDIMKISITIA